MRRLRNRYHFCSGAGPRFSTFVTRISREVFAPRGPSPFLIPRNGARKKVRQALAKSARCGLRHGTRVAELRAGKILRRIFRPAQKASTCAAPLSQPIPSITMPNIKLNLPENETPSQIALRGDSITIGRQPDNVIQIRDRTVSAHHAELILEDGHYRLHDRGATNGIRVDGRVVNDYHLRESCRIDLGGVECEFHVSPIPEGMEGDDGKLATRGEVAAAWRECETLRQRLEHAHEELQRLRSAVSGEREAVAKEYSQLATECHKLKTELRHRDGEVVVLQTGLRLLRRERENLQAALDEALHTSLTAARSKIISLPKPPHPLHASTPSAPSVPPTARSQ